MRFYFSGKPVAKSRHKSYRTIKGIKSYDPQSDVKNFDKLRAKSEMNEKGLKTLTTGPLHVELTVGIPYPKKFNRAQKNAFFVCTRPDIDNYVKYYLDVLNQIAYKDDALVSSITAKKIYSEKPFTEIEVNYVQIN